MAIAQKLLTNLADRRKKALAGGGAEKLAARREKGLMSARERVLALFEPNTFLEWGLHADHDCHDFGLEEKSLPGDGVITGVGYINGRPVAVFSQDFTVGGGALLQLGFDVVRPEGDVMHALALLGYEFGDGAVRGSRLQQFKVNPSDVKECRLDPLGGDLFATQAAQPERSFVKGHRLVE